jgi:hypothetical protein
MVHICRPECPAGGSHSGRIMETELHSSGVPSMEFLSHLNLARHVLIARQKVASSVANSQHAFSVNIVLCYATDTWSVLAEQIVYCAQY